MKFIHLSDIHLTPPGQKAADLDPWERLEACFRSIEERHPEAELLVVTGDVSSDGQAETYRLLNDRLSDLRLPCRLVPGNHDDRAAMVRHLKGLEKDEAGYLQGTIQTSAGAFIFLDSQSGPHDGSSHHGLLCEKRLAWLESRLEENADRSVYLFMHHPPFVSGMTFMDRTRLRNPEDLALVLEGREQVKHLFLGHLHRSVSGSWKGIPFSVQSSTCFQVALEMGLGPDLILSHEPPTYGVVLLSSERTVIHQEYFLDRSSRIVLKKGE